MLIVIAVELNEYIELLEKRLSQQTQKECTGIVAKKLRTCGEPSMSPPPKGAPSWAVKKDGEGK